MTKTQISQKQYTYINTFKNVLAKNIATATKNGVARSTGSINERFDCLEKTLQEYLNENSSYISHKEANAFLEKLLKEIKTISNTENLVPKYSFRIEQAKEIINQYEFKSIKQTLITLVKKVWLFILSIIVAS